MFYKIINHIKLAIQSKRPLIKIQINKNEMNLVRLLIKLNYINYIYKPLIKKSKKFDNYFYVSINTTNALNNIKNLYRPSGLRTIKYNELLKNRLKKKNIMIISTNKGLMTSDRAVKYRIGGILLINLTY